MIKIMIGANSFILSRQWNPEGYELWAILHRQENILEDQGTSESIILELILDKQAEDDVDGNKSGLCLMVGFGISGVELQVLLPQLG